MALRDFRDLIVWQKAMGFVESVYRATQAFPSDERFGLTSQLRRSAISLPSNIAEGQGRGADNDFSRFLKIAQSSRNEAITQIMLANRLGFLDESITQSLQDQADEIGRLLNGLLNSLKKK